MHFRPIHNPLAVSEIEILIVKGHRNGLQLSPNSRKRKSRFGGAMEYRTLGKTGYKVSVIGLGTMVHAGHFGPMKDEESLGAIDTALALGINLIDTSDAYGAGYSET